MTMTVVLLQLNHSMVMIAAPLQMARDSVLTCTASSRRFSLSQP